ncbi:hypothetical protein PR202_ga24615 [Eleusine coracana subsp. coracana]|uniref:Uncharacterized protein n=1 Tax=Eleusine coracana subsp. coracana TaxID=191504 RepID=A0AAV5D9C0_ELECO|nr:hypothetical protein PR202_ga24615 [Eleusine coracana subsp. coracana]
MLPGSEAGGSKGPGVNGGRNRFYELSKEVLQRIISFLPSGEAVQTMLRSLRITNAGDYPSANEMNLFVNMFLLFTNPRPLHLVEINTYPCAPDDDSKESLRYLELWVRNCLQRGAQVLEVHNTVANYWQLDHGLLSSKPQHLRVLDLLHVEMKGVLNNLKIRCLDFSSCPALEDLMMTDCKIEASLIVSPSLKRLSLKCCHFNQAARARISVPKLVFLILASCKGRTPVLGNMPYLVSGFVRLQADMDCCENKYETGYCKACSGCHDSIVGGSVILEALSGATHLDLTSIQTQFIFRKDLTQCPLFSKLKILLLNEWCVTLSLDALHCLLQHCPILEKLTPIS